MKCVRKNTNTRNCMYMNNNGVWIQEKKIVAEEEEMPYKGFSVE